MLRLYFAAFSSSLLLGMNQAMTVYVKNLCSTTIQLYDNVVVQPLAVGQQTTRLYSPGSHGMIRAGKDPQATLAEFSADGGFHWFDISIIPTGVGIGPDFCEDLEACKRKTGGVGFNFPMQITPLSNIDGRRCRQLTCLTDGCDDAYQYPKDDIKTHCCPFGTDFQVTFCPRGNPIVMNDQVVKAPASTTPTPTTPTPTTPTPTTPTPTTPTPTTPTPTTPAPTPEPTTEPPNTMAHVTESDVLTNASNSTSGSSSSITIDSNDNSSSSSVSQADLQDVLPTTHVEEVHQQHGIGDTSAAKEEIKITQMPVVANTKSKGSGSTVGIVVMLVFVFVACAAMAAIFVIRSKKRALDELHTKSPGPTTMRHHQSRSRLSTPRRAASKK